MSQINTPLREVSLRSTACAAIVMLSLDPLNPVKIFCTVTGVSAIWVAVVAGIAFLYILLVNASELLYFIVKVFFHSILSIFFKSMEVIGRQNIPLHGPVIFTGNHMNQFVDAAVILISNPRKISFLVAQKSYDKAIIGHFAKAVGSIPVARPQDYARKGEGEILLDGLIMKGRNGTQFSSLGKGDKIRPGRSADAYRVLEVISDEEAILIAEIDASPLNEEQNVWLKYDILDFVDQSKMFNSVHTALASGKSLCIFPEGGSHDRTDLLPLKVGIAAIAYGVLEKYDVNVPIVPVGLTYFRGHRFRGRVVVEFGAPIRIDEAMEEMYRKASKKDAYHSLLKQVARGMRSTLVTATDYAELKLVHVFRRLYQSQTSTITTQQKQDLARRLSLSYRMLKAKAEEGTVDGLADEMESLRGRLVAYQATLEEWGLRDYQVSSLATDDISYTRLIYTFLHASLVCLLAAFPTLLLNAPVGLAARFWAKREAAKDLKASRVKIQARDVLLSKKITFSMVSVPILWVSYALLLLLFSPLRPALVMLLFVCCPIFSYLGVRAVEAGMVDLKDLRPVFLQLLPAFRSVRQSLPLQRAQLQQDVREFLHRQGPSLGAVYWEKELGIWETAMEEHELLKTRNRSEDAVQTEASTGFAHEEDVNFSAEPN